MEPVAGPWALPDGWRWERLGDLGSWYGGGTPSKSVPKFWTDGIIPWVSPKDMKVVRICDSEDHITEAAVRESTARLVPSGSVICVMRSGILRHTFPVAVTTREVTLNQDLRAVRPRDGLSADFIAHFLRRYEQAILSECSKDGTTVNSIETERLLACPVPIPDGDTQRRIVARIDDLFAEIEEGEWALAEARTGVETYRKALLKAAVTGELTADWRVDRKRKHNGEQLLDQILHARRQLWAQQAGATRKKYSEPLSAESDGLPSLPEGWCWASVDQVAFVSGGITVDSKRRPAEPIEVPYLRVANVQRGFLDLEVVKTIIIDQSALADLSLQSGDVLLNEGGDRDKVGRGWVWEDQLPNCIHQNHVFKARPVSTLIHSKMLSMYLNELGRSYFLDESKQTTNLASISRAKVIRAPVPIAPIEESEEAVRLFSELAEAGERDLAQQCQTANTLRQSILAAAFRGELAV